ncbi:MAG: hypothetical protein J6B43_02435 [Lachnospiraceae bacterium]|nr:hypothetical protein [Lachnospiraceae bacterium]
MEANGAATGAAAEAGYPFAQLPLGMGMALGMNERAMDGYAHLTESQKEQLIMRCRDARSKEEMQRIVNELVPEGNISALYEGPATR